MSDYMDERNRNNDRTRTERIADAVLLDRVVQRDESALDALFGRYRAAVFAVCLQILKNRSEAEETLIDVFMEIWRRPERFDLSRRRLATELVMLARNRALSHLRSRTAQARSGAAAGLSHLKHYDARRADSIEGCSLVKGRKPALEALARLAPEQREAVRYAFFEGLTPREIAERLNLPLDTVKTRLRLGLIRFRDAFYRSDSKPLVHDHADSPEPVTAEDHAEALLLGEPIDGLAGAGSGLSDRDMTRVLLADDHDIFREGLAGVLQEHGGIQIIGEARDGHEAVQLADRCRPDVVVMDVSMPGLDGIEATRQIMRKQPSVRVIGLSMHERGDMTTAMCTAGATAYLSKSRPTGDLIATIHTPAGS